MARCHLTPEGPKKCGTTPENCPLQKAAALRGETVEHFNTLAEGRAAWEEKLAKEHADEPVTGLKKKFRKQETMKTLLGLTVIDISDQIPEEYRDGRLYNNKQISGKIDMSKLDENSYKEFGFIKRDLAQWKDFMKDSSWNARRDENYNATYYSTKISQDVAEKLSVEEQNTIDYYTGPQYRWINDALHDKRNLDDLDTDFPDWETDGLTPEQRKYDDMPKFDEIFTPDENGHYHYPDVAQKTKPLLFKITKNLDHSMEASEKKQRIVYRGARNEVFGKGAVADWVKNNRSIGTVIEFDGYTSSSYSPRIAYNFSMDATAYTDNFDQHRVIYEILTPEGIPVSSMSDLGKEDEVLLPRGQRYAIVGNYQTSMKEQSTTNTLHIVQMVAIDEDYNILDEDHTRRPKPLDI